ncbi:HlyD family type I secretion periplasmic adaptor subunit [Xylophilus sp.]|uniref:HlyD family type I secretion periplasmic adaptor subunit n=1 Tax=Xylophilus sp. TaxID=2653893 RepID=UPI0013BB0296|nr:HlyD family type I secretion periplasmic adaptor subunit [Xylophilus sp.]KAF1046717.1 MAG: Type I secretion system membrane fusion protein PrsE [Xylophilus sp.]
MRDDARRHATSADRADLPEVLRRQAEGDDGDGPPPQAARRRRLHWQWLVWGALGVLALIGLGYPVETVVVSPGKVIPSDRVKPVQHLEGGIVRAVRVREGQKVHAGQPLVEIDLGGMGLNLEEVSARFAAISATRVRLLAESQGRPLSRAAFARDIDPAVYEAETGAFAARTLEQRGVIAGAASQLEQARSRLLAQQARIAGLQERLALYERDLQISDQLLREKLIGQLEVLDKRRQLEATRSDLAVARQGVVSAQGAIVEAQARLAEAEGRFRRRASDELASVERELASVGEDLGRARSQRSRTVVQATSDGIVKGLRNPSPGWVVKPGESIMEIVPDEDRIMVEARLSPNDRGFVAVGQKARVKITAYDPMRYGAVDGEVRLVAADADYDSTVPGAPPYFRLLVSTTQGHVGPEANRITAGMEAEIDLIVGRDPFIWYLLRPVIKTQKEAFREP